MLFVYHGRKFNSVELLNAKKVSQRFNGDMQWVTYRKQQKS